MSIKTFRTLITVFFLCVFTVFAIYRVRLYLASDSKAPVITADTDTIEASVSVTDEELLAGMRAEDNMDGDVTGSLVVASKSKFIKKGTLNVNYAAFDKNNNVGVYTRELTYVDYESPKFKITQPLRILTGDTRANLLEHITATDCLNGNITSQIMYTLGDRTMTGDRASIQTMNLQVTNSAGDTVTFTNAMLCAADDWAISQRYVPYCPSMPELYQMIQNIQSGRTRAAAVQAETEDADA